MKKRIKIKKIILSVFTAICLGLGLTAPFINNNNDIVVNASSTNGFDVTSNGFTYTQTVTHLDGSESFLSKFYEDIGSASNLADLPSNTNINFQTTTFNQFSTGDDFYYYFDNDGFGNTYGFSISGITGFYNGFYFEINGPAHRYDIYLADITYNPSGVPTVSNQYLLDVNDTYYFTYSSTIAIHATYYGITSDNVGTFMSWFYNDFLQFHNGNYNMNKWHNGNFVAFNFADYFALADYFNVTRDLLSTASVYNFYSNGNITFEGSLVCSEGILTINYFQFTQSHLFSFVDMTLDELSFIYSLCLINNFPQFSNTYITSYPNYYRLNYLNNLNFNIYSFTMSFINLDGTTIDYISTLSISDNGDIYFSNSNGTFNIFNKNSLTWYSPFTINNNYFIFNNILPMPYYQINQLLYIGTAYEGLPELVKGWYTFDLSPFDNITDEIDIDLDISFTADSNGYNNLRIIGGTVLGTYVATIYYRNLDDERNVINSYVPYQYQRSPYLSEWTTYNARQLFFDETLIDYDDYTTLTDLGVYTFISNNLNNNQTMVDLFWGIAEVPIVTIRKVFDFEILGTNVTNFIMSMITISIILFLIRRLF